MLKTDIKEPWIEIPFIRLGNHWLIHEVFNGVVSDHTSVVEWHGDFRLFWIPLISRSSWDSYSSLKYLSYHRAQNCKKVIKTIKHDQHWIFNSMSFVFQWRLFLFLIFWKQRLLTNSVRCVSWPDVFFSFFFFFFFLFLKTLCVSLDWKMLECFASSNSSGGLRTDNIHHANPFLEVKETKQEGKRRVIIVEAYRRSWQSIHHR